MRKLIKITAPFLALMLTACSTTVEVPASESIPVKPETVTQEVTSDPINEDPVYSVYLNFGWEIGQAERSGFVYMDRYGNLLPSYEAPTKLYDIMTGELVAKTVSKTEDTGEDNEYGYPITVTYTRLYDADGNLLYDWEDTSYTAAYNGLLLKHDTISMMEMPEEDFRSALWDPKTGETVIDGVFQLIKVDDHRVLALDAQGLLLGMLDETGKPVAGFPVSEKYYYPTVEEGRILVDTYDPYGESQTKADTYRLLDNDLNTIFEANELNIYYFALRGPYATYNNEGERGILSLETLEPVYIYESANDSVSYFDGDVMTIRSGNRTQEWSSRLFKADGTPLSDKYDDIIFDDGDFESDEPASYFLARKGDELSILSRSGKVVASGTFGGLSNAYINSGYIEYSTEVSGDFRAGLLDENLNVVISAEENSYQSVSRKVDYSNGVRHEANILTATHYNASDEYRTDILTLDGSPVITDLTEVGTATDEAIAVVRGFNVGLIDYNGEWIAKHSIYNDINLD